MRKKERCEQPGSKSGLWKLSVTLNGFLISAGDIFGCCFAFCWQPQAHSKKISKNLLERKGGPLLLLSRSRALASSIPPTLALRRLLWTLNPCKYHSRVPNHPHFQERPYITRPEMAVSRWSTSVISALSSDTEPTIIITFDKAKYIFNAGENTGRAWIQSRANWRRVKALFFTQVGTQRMSGMPGTVLRLSRRSVPR